MKQNEHRTQMSVYRAIDIFELKSRLMEAVTLKHLREPERVCKNLKRDPLVLFSFSLTLFFLPFILFNLWKNGNCSPEFSLLALAPCFFFVFWMPWRQRALYASIGWKRGPEPYRLWQRTLAVRNLLEPLGLWNRNGISSLIGAYAGNFSSNEVAHYYRTYIPAFIVVCVSGFLAPALSIENNWKNFNYVAQASFFLGFLFALLIAGEVIIRAFAKENEKKNLMATLHSIHVSMGSDRESNYG